MDRTREQWESSKENEQKKRQSYLKSEKKTFEISETHEDEGWIKKFDIHRIEEGNSEQLTWWVCVNGLQRQRRMVKS